MQGDRDNPGWRLDFVAPGHHASQISKRCYQADGPVTTHPEITDIVKKDNANLARRNERFTNQSPYHGVGAARFVHDRGSKPVEFRAKDLQALAERSLTHVRSARYYNPGGFTRCMRIDKLNAP